VAKHWLAGCGPDGGAPHSRDGGSRCARGWPIATCFIGGEGERAFTATGHPGLNA
jgi:hypothetical protein